MLTQIKKIKNLGVFDDYEEGAEAQHFGRYNVVYGENGAGKTTLSRLLSCLEVGEHTDFPDLEFLIESHSGQLTHSKPYTRKTRVFNTDYVEANIGRLDGPMRHILIVGEENKALAEQLKVEIATKTLREQRIVGLSALIAKLANDKGKLFSQIAKTIGEAVSGSTLRGYRKPDAEIAYGKMTMTELLSDAQREAHRATVRQDEMASIADPGVDANIAETLATVAQAASRAGALACKTAQSAVIEHLAKHPAIAVWVEEGVHLHAQSDAGRCEFCDRPMPVDRLKALSDHFSLEDQKLKEEIDAERAQLKALQEVIERMNLPDPLAFYSELKADYVAALSQFEAARAELVNQLDGVEKALQEKLTLRTTVYEPEISSDPAPFAAALNAVQAMIARHNAKSAQFDEEKQDARAALEGHYLLTIKDQVQEVSEKISAAEAQSELLQRGGEGLEDPRSMAELGQSISDKRAKVSSEHAGGAGLTEYLKQFLGRTDLRFESAHDGYRVLRRGKPAKRLSEGERTAIAFLYFLVHLKDQDFDLAEGLVVIDDPISSLDASAIYQAFSFLKKETQGAKQLFILTHNFEFLKLLTNWLRNIKPKSIKRSYSMVICSETAEGRSARLLPLDKLLIEHATEYHYLFKLLYNFKSDGTIASCYHIPNVARKVLETFLDFHVPSAGSVYAKLEETKFDDHKKTAIYKFANDASHFTGKDFNPALVAETQKNTVYLLEMIKDVAPLHYTGLEKLCQPEEA